MNTKENINLLVKDVMEQKPSLLHEEDTILYASKFMKEERIRNLPVVNENNVLVGLITLREIINGLTGNPDKILIRDSMIKLITTTGPNIHLHDAIEVILQNKYGCLPVVDKNNKLLGMLTEADFVKAIHKQGLISMQ